MRIALLPWGNVVEDFLDAIGLSLEDLRDELSGGWLFGYVDALRLAGVDTEILFVSARITDPVHWRHAATGASMWIFPASNSYRILRRRLADPYAWSARDAIGDASPLRLPAAILARQAASYCATPIRPLMRHLHQRHYDAVLCQEYEYPRFDVCAVLGVMLRVPVFATFQGGTYRLTMVEKLVRPITMRLCSGLIIASASEEQRVRQRYRVPPAKVARIFNPFDASTWPVLDRAQARVELGLQPDASIVAWHGRVDLYNKGLDVLCDAWRHLSQLSADPKLQLLLVGTGADADELQRRIEQLSLENVHWINEYVVDRDLLRRYLAAADVYVFPSRHEGFPSAMIEAMACGLPVIATDASGVSDILAGGEASGGVIVPLYDGPAVAEALHRVLEDPVRRSQLGDNARARAEAAFTPASVGHQLRDFLDARTARTRSAASTIP